MLDPNRLVNPLLGGGAGTGLAGGLVSGAIAGGASRLTSTRADGSCNVSAGRAAPPGP